VDDKCENMLLSRLFWVGTIVIDLDFDSFQIITKHHDCGITRQGRGSK